MSFILSCCSQNNEKDENSLKNKLQKISGKERILKLTYKDDFPEEIKYFKISKEENIYENQLSNDTFNINSQNSFFDFSNLCLLCGGNNCSSEYYNENNKYAIKGLISELLYNNIYVSQRPNMDLINKYKIIQSFKANNIKLIINCQIQGEHPKCGPLNGLEPDSGYTYSPSCFIEQNIDYINCGFKENEGPPTLDFMLNIIKKISYIIHNNLGKIFVHGHSADGRCCLVVACFAIFYFNKTADETINEIRKKRQNAINNGKQEEFCKKFEIYMNMLKNMFPGRPISINKFIKYQNDINIVYNIPNIITTFFKDINNKEIDLNEIININYVPKIIVKCCDKIISLKNNFNIKNEELYNLLINQNNITQNEYNEIVLIKKELNKNIWESFDKSENLLVIIELLYIWLNSYVINCINPKKIEKLYITKISDIYNFSDIFKNKHQLTSIEINDFIKIFKIILSKTEYETIKFISIFISLIYPGIKNAQNINSEDINSFKRLLYKIAFLILGFNLDKINDLSYESKEFSCAKNLIYIFDFFIFYSSNEDNNIIKVENNESNWLDDYLNKKKIFEEKDKIYNDDDDILIFLKNRPKLDFVSIKSFL